jgi:leader peptidase (prepilin peptidase)/N-methyltransferase
MTPSTEVAIIGSLVVGLGAGVLVQRAAARFVPADAPVPVAVGTGGADSIAESPGAAGRSVSLRVPPAVSVAASGVLCGLAGLRFGLTWQLPAFLVLAVAGVLLAVIDLEHRLLPNRIVLRATIAAAALLTLAAAAGGDWHRLRTAVLGGVVLFVLFLALALFAPSGLGMGDVKLSAWLGLYLGWVGTGTVAVGAVAGFLVQAVVAVALLIVRKVGVKGEIPFGPALLAGAVLAIGWGPALVTAWLGTTGRA